MFRCSKKLINKTNHENLLALKTKFNQNLSTKFPQKREKLNKLKLK